MPPSHLHREQTLSDVVPVLQLQQAWGRYRTWKPTQVAFDPSMEATRVTMLWASTFVLSQRSPAICLAMTVALLNNLTFNLSQEIVTVTEDEKWQCFIDRFTPEPMQSQLNRSTHIRSKEGLDSKIDELENAILWLMNFISDENGKDFVPKPGHDYVSFVYGAYSFLSDLLVHLKYRRTATQEED